MRHGKIFCMICSFIIILFITGCGPNTEKKFLDDLTNGGYNLEEITSSFEENFNIINSYSFSDSISSDFGYIYEVENDINKLYQNRIDYSYTSNDIVFIYKIDNFILEIYHDLNSTFPGFIRHYDFEANYQYHLYFGNETEMHPILNSVLNKESQIDKKFTESEIGLSRTSFTTSDVPILDMYRFKSNETSEHLYSFIVLVTDSVESAEVIYSELDDLIFPGNNVFVYTQYQNLVFRISTTYSSYESINEYLFEDITYETYNMLSTD